MAFKRRHRAVPRNPKLKTYHFCMLKVVGGSVYAIEHGTKINPQMEWFATENGFDPVDAYKRWRQKIQMKVCTVKAIKMSRGQYLLEIDGRI